MKGEELFVIIAIGIFILLFFSALIYSAIVPEEQRQPLSWIVEQAEKKNTYNECYNYIMQEMTTDEDYAERVCLKAYERRKSIEEARKE